ncbi:uncharacterized protein LOC111871010 isoform X2 [Cryptotermes secundus]|nr:uncharacterized protein LOC111871010 isoform X2 [Cryptotermes secundus]
MNSLLATYRKVRQKLTAAGKSGSGADEVDAPNWFAYKAFAFLHNRYQPRRTINTEHKMDAIKVEPASDEEADTASSVHDFLQINIESEYSVAAEAETSEVKEMAWDVSPVKNEFKERERAGTLQVCLDRNMEWTNDSTINFIKAYEKHPVLWDATHCLYKVKPKKTEAWDSIATELNVVVAELKKKMNSLLATYRKVRQKLTAAGKSGSGADEMDAPNWFAYKAFAFLHNRYQPRRTINTEDGGEASDSQLEEAVSMCSDEGDLVSNQETDHAQTQVNKAPPTRNENKVFVSPRKIPRKSANTEDPRIGEAYTALQAAIAKKRDEFDAYGEYIANVLRSMDKPTRAFVKKEFSDIIFKAESGIYTSPSAITQLSGTSCDYSRSSSSNSNCSYSSIMPSPPQPIAISTQHAETNQQRTSQQTSVSAPDGIRHASSQLLDFLHLE